MNNPPMLNYKPGLTLDTPIEVTLAAADWLILMTHLSQDHVDTDGVNHIISIMMPQVRNAIYSAASISAVNAHIHEARSRNPLEQIIGQMGGEPCDTCGRIPNPISAPCADCADYPR